MKLQMHYTTKLWGVLHSDKRSRSRLRKLSLVHVVLRDTQVETFVECNGGYFLQTEKKNGIRNLKVLEIASRKTVLLVDKKILCCLVTAYEFRSYVKMQAMLNHELMPLPLSLAEIISHNSYYNFSRLCDRESQVFGVNHTLRKCCFVNRWLISLVAAYGKPEIAIVSLLFVMVFPKGPYLAPCYLSSLSMTYRFTSLHQELICMPTIQR